MPGEVRLLAAACCFPPQTRSLPEVLADEGLGLEAGLAERLGVQSVHVCLSETSSGLALAAARQALARAGLEGRQVDAILDYSFLPQEYLAPAWNMSNRIQHELQATRAITLGFSGGGATNFHVALETAACLLRSDESLQTILLLGAEAATPARRVVNPDRPVTVLGDGASAMIVGRNGTGPVVLDSELCSDGQQHAVYYIRGGGLAYPDRGDLYCLSLDTDRYSPTRALAGLRRLMLRLLGRAGLQPQHVTAYIYPNFSAADRAQIRDAFDLPEARAPEPAGLAGHGHVHATDLVLNYLAALDSGGLSPGDHVMILSHGLGFLQGASLLRV